MKHSLFRFLSLSAAFWLIACGGGDSSGGGGGSTNSSTPALSAVVLTPSSVAAGSTVTFTITFYYTDALGDLDGGVVYLQYNGVDNNLATFGSSYAGSTSGYAVFTLSPLALNSTKGTVTIPVSIADKLGNKSYSYNCTITQS
ncbi:MAG: hypothetical protein LLG93_13355 [Deltaproteobacteria bacterium]|nr:hypothetical protein [Deltaproteobacteria bacterium]